MADGILSIFSPSGSPSQDPFKPAGQALGVQTFRSGGHGRHLEVVQVTSAVWHNFHWDVPVRESASDGTW
jgi:hypothetical protein